MPEIGKRVKFLTKHIFKDGFEDMRRKILPLKNIAVLRIHASKLQKHKTP